MKRVIGLLGIAVAGSVAILLVQGCQSGQKGTKAGMMKPPFGGKEDLAGAASLWRSMDGYRSWPSYPGKSGFQEGGSPHGKFVKYYLNSAASRNPKNPGDGAIVVKENYGAKDASKLGAVTVMKKIRGYDPEDGDWFWVKFDPKGGVMKNPMGMSLAGRVAKGMKKGCIACHRDADGGDFYFLND